MPDRQNPPPEVRSPIAAGPPDAGSRAGADAPGPDADIERVEAALGGARMDMHCHSRFSSKPLMAALGLIDCPECYSPPEKVYDQAIARGMDLVTITDHDSIEGALELIDRGFEGVTIGEEVTVHFPEDRCRLHVLVWGLTPAQHEQIGALGLREDVYEFALWLRGNCLPHALAHPLYVQNGKLTVSHLERAALLFKGFEALNGAHSGAHRDALEVFLASLDAERVAALAEKHGLAPVWPRAWQKSFTGGSDDHGLLNVGRTWTRVRDPNDPGRRLTDPVEFLRLLMAGHSEVGGAAGRSDLLAHQLTSVAFRFYADAVHDRLPARRRALASKLGRFAGVDAPRPSKKELLLDTVKRRVFGQPADGLPIVDALRRELGPLLEKYPDLKRALDPKAWDSGPPISLHASMADFADDLSAALGRSMAGGAISALRERDRLGLVDHLLSYSIVQAARIPYIVSLFHQNKERQMLERLKHDLARPGSQDSPLDRPMRVSLFTDTLGDVNGVCRFIQNVAEQANKTGRDLRVITSTSFAVPQRANIFNFEPVFATKMPKYEQLEIVLPPLVKILRHLDEHQPDVIHISTPGPMGCIGYLAAKMLKAPVLGVYHTDFPAYIDHLFDDHAFTRMAEWFMRAFYAPFCSVFTRSQDYVDSLVEMGLERERVVPLMPGLDTETFDVRHRDEGLWRRLSAAAPAGTAPISGTSVKALYVGRVSVEKNLPMLTRVWKRVQSESAARGVDLDLIVVGDGPYRKKMQEELAGSLGRGGRGRAHFLGFRHGVELSQIYATADFFLFPSTTDTLGQVVMESQASGLPVIVTDQGGPKEVVDHELTGYVLGAEDSEAWAARIMELATDHEKRRRMGRAAHTRMARYSIDASFEHFWKAHEQAWRGHLASIGITPRNGAGGDTHTNGSPVITPEQAPPSRVV